ncbi:MAG: hypothetical protein GWN95_20710 [Gammaproteobacteria bacterium]|nr:hypothetical protein [Gammaproteobacteria bacterium]
METRQLQGLAGAHVRLRPTARQFVGKVEAPRRDDEWRVEAVGEDAVRLRNERSSHLLELPHHCVVEWICEHGGSDGAEPRGLLVLNVEVHLYDDAVDFVPLGSPS